MDNMGIEEGERVNPNPNTVIVKTQTLESEISKAPVINNVPADQIVSSEPKIASYSDGIVMVGSKEKRIRKNKARNLRPPKKPRKFRLEGCPIRTPYFCNQALLCQVGLTIPPRTPVCFDKEMIYPLDKIILTGEWDSLLDIDALWEAKQDLSPADYPTFVRNRVHLLGEKDGEERKKLACIFSYITHLIKFKDRHSIDSTWVETAKHHKFPSIIDKNFTALFAPSDKLRKEELLISYALVLTLFVDNFITDSSDIGNDLRLNEEDIRLHFEHLGCKMHQGLRNTFELW